MNSNNVPQSLYNSLFKNSHAIAFCIENKTFTYKQLAERVSFIQSAILSHNHDYNSIGIIANQDFDTYSAIVACLLSGITYVPIESSHPDERNNHIIRISKVGAIFCSDVSVLNQEFFEAHKPKIVQLENGRKEITDLKWIETENPAYILFTSGTTGVPKGVPISHQNLEAFVENVIAMNLDINAKSRFLQVFDLTFDLSVFSYLIPLLHGSSIYCLPKTPLKYTLAVQLMEDEAITHVLTVPSFVSYLKPYFEEITLPEVKKWLFCGEALKSDLVKGWQKCLPNADIYNVYGPTEATIFCTSYTCDISHLKEMNGIVCIGKPFAGTGMDLTDENGNMSKDITTGELYLSGNQLTSGYLQNKEKSRSAFSTYNTNFYYHSGDICFKDLEGDFFFVGRNDSQIKVQGYRVELSEIEYHAHHVPGIGDAVVIAVSQGEQNILQLFYTSTENLDANYISSLLATKLPIYMVPSIITRIDAIPYNLNGKVDKKALYQLVTESIS